MLLTFYPCWTVLLSWSSPSEIRGLPVIKAILGKTNFCTIGQIIHIIYITIKNQWKLSKIDSWTLKMQKADSH